jgi:hypothetical protein
LAAPQIFGNHFNGLLVRAWAKLLAQRVALVIGYARPNPQARRLESHFYLLFINNDGLALIYQLSEK